MCWGWWRIRVQPLPAVLDKAVRCRRLCNAALRQCMQGMQSQKHAEAVVEYTAALKLQPKDADLYDVAGCNLADSVLVSEEGLETRRNTSGDFLPGEKAHAGLQVEAADGGHDFVPGLMEVGAASIAEHAETG